MYYVKKLKTLVFSKELFLNMVSIVSESSVSGIKVFTIKTFSVSAFVC